MRLGDRIEIQRKYRKLTALELADELGVPPMTLYDWVHGNATPDEDMLNKMKDYFGCSMDYLFGHDNVKYRSAHKEYKNIAQDILNAPNGSELLETINDIFYVGENRMNREFNLTLYMLINLIELALAFAVNFMSRPEDLREPGIHLYKDIIDNMERISDLSVECVEFLIHNVFASVCTNLYELENNEGYRAVLSMRPSEHSLQDLRKSKKEIENIYQKLPRNEYK